MTTGKDLCFFTKWSILYQNGRKGAKIMICSVQTLGITGIQGNRVVAECYISNGLPGFDIVGLPDAAV